MPTNTIKDKWWSGDFYSIDDGAEFPYITLELSMPMVWYLVNAMRVYHPNLKPVREFMIQCTKLSRTN